MKTYTLKHFESDGEVDFALKTKRRISQQVLYLQTSVSRPQVLVVAQNFLLQLGRDALIFHVALKY